MKQMSAETQRELVEALLVQVSDAAIGSDDLDEKIAALLDERGIKYTRTLWNGIPQWTQSVDCARSLVPYGHAWTVSCNYDDEDLPDHTAMVARRSTISMRAIGELWKSNASTPALALAHCALKAVFYEARAEMGE